MDFKSAEFIASYPKVESCPKEIRPEFAFIGRSNVGKSSLINMLTSQKGLAKVSARPGKTQLLNYFLIDDQWYMVDLPGYGYARLSKSKVQSLAKMIDGYLMQRASLTMAFVLIDINVPPMKKDITFINHLGERGIPFAILFTKCDKLGPNAALKAAETFMAELAETWETLPDFILTSADRRTGKDELITYIRKVVKSLR
jgi:GTP-binding protein